MGRWVLIKRNELLLSSSHLRSCGTVPFGCCNQSHCFHCRIVNMWTACTTALIISVHDVAYSCCTMWSRIDVFYFKLCAGYSINADTTRKSRQLGWEFWLSGISNSLMVVYFVLPVGWCAVYSILLTVGWKNIPKRGCSLESVMGQSLHCPHYWYILPVQPFVKRLQPFRVPFPSLWVLLRI